MKCNLHKKAYWHSRRGLKELDIILLPFVENDFPNLKKLEKLSFLELLENEDVILMDWFVNQVSPPKKLSKIINQVLSKHLNK